MNYLLAIIDKCKEVNVEDVYEKKEGHLKGFVQRRRRRIITLIDRRGLLNSLMDC